MPKLGHFAFDKKIIARGFTSVVYKGIDEITNKKVAIKCIDEAILDEPGKKKMLANELSIQWQLKQQPYVVEIKGQFYQNDCIYIVSEFCQFGDLKNKIKQKGKFVEAKAVSYMTDIIRGFQTLFRHNIVHRDLKPSNIMISKKGIKIGDFGFAYKVNSNQNADQISLPSAGSPLYMAPEVLENGENSGYESDIWSLGVVFFQMLTGRLPFPAKNKQTLIKLIDKIVIRTIIPENLSPRSKQFLMRTLKKDPSKRMTPQQLTNYEFDQQILFNIQMHRERKLEHQLKLRQEREFSTSSEDRISSQQKQYQAQKVQHYNHTHLHHHNPQVDKKQQIHHHQSNKDFEPQKPHVTHHINTVPQQLIVKKPLYRVFEVGQNTNISRQASTNTNNNNTNNYMNDQLQRNSLKAKNLLDPQDIKFDRFKRKSSQKNDLIAEFNTITATTTNKLLNTNYQQQRRKNQIAMILNKSKSQKQTDNTNNNNKQSLKEDMKGYQPSAYILHKRQINYGKIMSQIGVRKNNGDGNNRLQQQIVENNEGQANKNKNKKKNGECEQQKQIPLKAHQSTYSNKQMQDAFSKQPTIHSASQLQENRRVNNHHKLRREDSKFSENSHNSHHLSHQDHSPVEEMKKQQIIEILLDQVDIIRFLSRIMHKIQQLHHINTSERHQRSVSQHSNKQSANNQHNRQQVVKQQPAIYIQLKQLIYKTIQQIEKLQFLPDQIAYKFFRSQQFDQIKIILDTYKSKLDLVGVKSLQWKGVRILEKQLEREILLIFSTVNDKILKLKSKHLQNDPKVLKKLNRKIEVLDHLIVFRYDYLILQRQEIFLHQQGHKNAHHNQKCSRIKEIIQQRHSRSNDMNKNFTESCNQLRKIQNVMKKIRLI